VPDLDTDPELAKIASGFRTLMKRFFATTLEEITHKNYFSKLPVKKRG
jgi:hypothetical protein